MSLAAQAALVGAESILALTPVAIKKTPLDPTSAIWSRILTSAILGYLITGDRNLPRKEWGGAAALGHANLLHVASSYEAFRNLPAGQAMSLLYTYPLWNLVFNSVFGNEKIVPRDYGGMLVAMVGSFLLNTDPGVAAETPLGRKPNYGWGVLMGLVMALTESAMHVLLRGLGWRDPAKSVWVVNSSASAWMAALQGLQVVMDGGHDKIEVRGSWWDAAWLTLFHGVTMFSGYWLRFFAVPRLSTVTYSILSYAGLLASYLFGMLFLGERPGWLSLLGAVLIIASGIYLQIAGTDKMTKVIEREEVRP
jgi:drug/metabolite transporter (DMT)-like permease